MLQRILRIWDAVSIITSDGLRKLTSEAKPMSKGNLLTLEEATVKGFERVALLLKVLPSVYNEIDSLSALVEPRPVPVPQAQPPPKHPPLARMGSQPLVDAEARPRPPLLRAASTGGLGHSSQDAEAEPLPLLLRPTRALCLASQGMPGKPKPWRSVSVEVVAASKFVSGTFAEASDITDQLHAQVEVMKRKCFALDQAAKLLAVIRQVRMLLEPARCI